MRGREEAWSPHKKKRKHWEWADVEIDGEMGRSRGARPGRRLWCFQKSLT
jgi:hypothetical protein